MPTNLFADSPSLVQRSLADPVGAAVPADKAITVFNGKLYTEIAGVWALYGDGPVLVSIADLQGVAAPAGKSFGIFGQRFYFKALDGTWNESIAAVTETKLHTVTAAALAATATSTPFRANSPNAGDVELAIAAANTATAKTVTAGDIVSVQTAVGEVNYQTYLDGTTIRVKPFVPDATSIQTYPVATAPAEGTLAPGTVFQVIKADNSVDLVKVSDTGPGSHIVIGSYGTGSGGGGGGDVTTAQLNAAIAAIADASYRNVSIAVLPATSATIPPEVNALTGDDAQENDRVRGVAPGFIIYYRRNATAWAEESREEIPSVDQVYSPTSTNAPSAVAIESRLLQLVDNLDPQRNIGPADGYVAADSPITALTGEKGDWVHFKEDVADYGGAPQAAGTSLVLTVDSADGNGDITDWANSDALAGTDLTQLETDVKNYGPKWDLVRAQANYWDATNKVATGSDGAGYVLTSNAINIKHPDAANTGIRDALTAVHGDVVFVTGDQNYRYDGLASAWVAWNGTDPIAPNPTLDPVTGNSSWGKLGDLGVGTYAQLEAVRVFPKIFAVFGEADKSLNNIWLLTGSEVVPFVTEPDLSTRMAGHTAYLPTWETTAALADSTQELQEAFDNSVSRVQYIPEGTYTVSAQLVAKAGTNLIFEKDAVIRRNWAGVQGNHWQSAVIKNENSPTTQYKDGILPATVDEDISIVGGRIEPADLTMIGVGIFLINTKNLYLSMGISRTISNWAYVIGGEGCYLEIPGDLKNINTFEDGLHIVHGSGYAKVGPIETGDDLIALGTTYNYPIDGWTIDLADGAKSYNGHIIRLIRSRKGLTESYPEANAIFRNVTINAGQAISGTDRNGLMKTEAQWYLGGVEQAATNRPFENIIVNRLKVSGVLAGRTHSGVNNRGAEIASVDSIVFNDCVLETPGGVTMQAIDSSITLNNTVLKGSSAYETLSLNGSEVAINGGKIDTANNTAISTTGKSTVHMSGRARIVNKTAGIAAIIPKGNADIQIGNTLFESEAGAEDSYGIRVEAGETQVEVRAVGSDFSAIEKPLLLNAIPTVMNLESCKGMTRIEKITTGFVATHGHYSIKIQVRTGNINDTLARITKGRVGQVIRLSAGESDPITNKVTIGSSTTLAADEILLRGPFSLESANHWIDVVLVNAGYWEEQERFPRITSSSRSAFYNALDASSGSYQLNSVVIDPINGLSYKLNSDAIKSSIVAGATVDPKTVPSDGNGSEADDWLLADNTISAKRVSGGGGVASNNRLKELRVYNQNVGAADTLSIINTPNVVPGDVVKVVNANPTENLTLSNSTGTNRMDIGANQILTPGDVFYIVKTGDHFTAAV